MTKFGLNIKQGVAFNVREQKNVLTSFVQYGLGISLLMTILLICVNILFIQIIAVIILLLSIILITFIGIWFAIKDPKRLQSEKHIERMTILEQGMPDNKNGDIYLNPTKHQELPAMEITNLTHLNPDKQEVENGK